VRKYLEIGAGFMLLAIGLIGGLIPILQGWPFGIAGLVILARHFHWAKRTLEWAKAKWDKVRGKKAEEADPAAPCDPAAPPASESATMKKPL
jgi:hypothetical protein